MNRNSPAQPRASRMLRVSTLLLTALLATAAAAAGSGGGGHGGSASTAAYQVPWSVLSSGLEGPPGAFALYWFPSPAEGRGSSGIDESRNLTLWSSRCVGMGWVTADNRGLRERFGIGAESQALLVTDSGGEIARVTAGSVPTLESIEEMIENELDVRRRILEDTLDAAKQQRRQAEANSISLYRQAYTRYCLFPSLGQKAGQALIKHGRPVAEDVVWMAAEAPNVVEPDFGKRTGERIERSIARGIEAERVLQFEVARRHYEEARSIDRGDSTPLRYLGELYRYHTGDWQAATSLFEQILAMPADPLSRAVALHGLGAIGLESGDVQEGLQRFEESLATYPLALTYRSLAEHWNSQGDAEQAFASAGQALGRAPDDVYNELFFASYLVAQGRGEEARSLAQRHGSTLEASALLASIYAQLGDRNRALSYLRRHLDEFRSNDAVRERDRRAVRRNPSFSTLSGDPEFDRLTRP